jgi:cystathionine beta-lyase
VQPSLSSTSQLPDADSGLGPFNGLDLNWLRAKPGVKWRGVEPDVLPAWLADMDFPTPEPVRHALRVLIDSADLGYPGWLAGTPLRVAFADRMRARFGWAADPARVRETSEVVQGAQLALHFGTEPGDTIAVHTPTYPPFLETITAMSRQMLPIPMVDEPGGWTFEIDRLDQNLRTSRCRALLLVNPHNPTGRVFTIRELQALAELAERHDLLVISDEIHADLAYQPHRHIPIATLPGMAARTVTLSSASKTFNLAGLRCAVAHIGPDHLLATWDQQPVNLYGCANVFGVAATLAAWEHGDEWLAAVVAHLDSQRHLLADALAQQLPRVRHHLVEASYLAWIDFRALGLGADPAAALLKSARVALSSGPSFGPGGDGFARLNFATSADLLGELLERISRAVNNNSEQRG